MKLYHSLVVSPHFFSLTAYYYKIVSIQFMFNQGVYCIYTEWIFFLGQWFQRENVQTLHQQSLALQTKILELQKSPFARTKQHEVLENLESMQVQTSKLLLGLRKRNSVYFANKAFVI